MFSEFLHIDKFIATDFNSFDIFYTIIGVLGLAVMLAFFLSRFNKMFLRKGFDTKLSEFIPLERILEDNKTIICSNDTIIRVFKVQGTSSIFDRASVKKSLFDAKKKCIDTACNSNVNFRIISIRERKDRSLKKDFNNSVLKAISDKWDENRNFVFENNYYIVVSMDGKNKNALEDLNEVVYSVKAILDPFNAQELDINSFPKENPLSVFSKILNPVSKPNILIHNANKNNLYDAIVSEEVFFSKEGNIRFRYGEDEKFMAVIGMKNVPNTADEQMIDDILSLNFELNILNNFTSFSKDKAIKMLRQQKLSAGEKNYSYGNVAQYDDALESIDSVDEEYQRLLKFSQTFFIYGDTEEELDKNVFELIKILRVYGVVPCREGWISQASWFNNFPGFDNSPRVYNILSNAVACLISFEKQPSGFDKSDWGQGEITDFPTSQGTAYQFQFHIDSDDGAVGHTISIGPTGQGKTTLYSFLAAQAMRHDKLRTFFFDRYRGAEIFTNAIDGDYVKFNLGSNFEKQALQKSTDKDNYSKSSILNKEVALNPFKMEDSPENRSFLKRWLREISLVSDSKSEEEIARAVTTNFEYLDIKDRSLKKIYESAFSPTGLLKKELKRWVDDKEYGEVFNAESDSLTLDSRFIGFDFTYILDDPVLAPAMVSYIMNRIQNITGKTGDPSLIIIDETAPLLKNALFRKNFAIGLQEGRKKRQVYLSAFQEPSVIDKLGMGEVIRGQAQTEVFFRNPMATEKDYENWKLSPKEMAFIQGRMFRELKYAILLKKPAINESVILNVDISGLGPYLKLFNSGRKHVLMAEEFKKNFGNSWVEEFLKIK